ncbi:MAG: 50S ribosomal protein L22, partial [Bacilli bacterium]|nr:50S ribosomal protein L22 [Bacilli bacterium]
LIRGKKANEAMAILKNLNKKAARLIEKVLVSAVSNAENNLGLKQEDLFVKEAFINEGATLKRIRFGSRGHIDRNDHRTSHINIVVAEKK